MPSIRLVEITDQLLEASRESQVALEAYAHAALGSMAAEILEVVAQTGEFLKAKPRPAPWGCYLAVDDAVAQLIGTCGFKAGPTADRLVEIAYYTFPAYEGRGYATAMAAELKRLGAGWNVIAHTLPERNASCRVLEKNRFALAGEVVDPEDGPVWLWTLKK
ncbi:GNAT family N-acetyltransferase [Lacipirellula parvula]|uniref:N-acetyltransferase domain-containing protein n=1 Tax=Lacipirellula parvula TaxID=2650471 RepID=A0A5K7XCM9_9BACT|nr:GNAT family N-acetyltransferase [Lacipirellula parvula]BBO33747.1 hypothetical protein PLANPX_3359 [Lacipirellula parvula]